MKKEMEEKL